jgi:hypothetical protein
MVDRGTAKVVSPVWLTIDRGITDAVVAVTGPPHDVNVMNEGKMHAHALQLVTGRGAFFFKSAEVAPEALERAVDETLTQERAEMVERGASSGPIPEHVAAEIRSSVREQLLRAFDMTIGQALTEGVLPAGFPVPKVVTHGVVRATDDTDENPSRTAWIISQWVEGCTAHEHQKRGTAGLNTRITGLARHTVLPVEGATDPAALVDFSQAMRDSYIGNWKALEQVFAQPERRWSDDPRDDRSVEEWAAGIQGPDGYEYGNLGPKTYEWLRNNFEFLKANEQTLAPRLVGDHVVSADAHRENVMIAEAGAEADVLIDGVYGKGPAEFTAFTLVLDAWHAGICDSEDLDQTMAAVGASPKVTDAWLAGCAGFAIARRFGLKPTPGVGHFGAASSADPKFLLEKLAERIEARRSASSGEQRSLPALGPELTGSGVRLREPAPKLTQPFTGPGPDPIGRRGTAGGARRIQPRSY